MLVLVGLCRCVPAPEADKDYGDSVQQENLPARQPDAVLEVNFPLDIDFDLDTELDDESPSESLVVNNFFESGSVIVFALNLNSRT